MTSRSKTRWATDAERRATAQKATDTFLVWAQQGGKRDVTITLEARDWAIVCGAVTLHAAELAVSDGNPDLMVSIALDLVGALRRHLGTSTTDAVLSLVGAMMTGIEE